nr:Lsr2 family protein [Actinomycetales bacterium]
MARKVIVQLVDDVDGGDANETVSFALDGIQYEIDLNEGNASELRNSLERWISSARRVAGRRTQNTGRAAKAGGTSDAAKIRAWAREQGIETSARGRIPSELRERYEREAN